MKYAYFVSDFVPSSLFFMSPKKRKTPLLKGRREKDKRGGEHAPRSAQPQLATGALARSSARALLEPPSAHHLRPQQVKMLSWKYKRKVLVVSLSTHLDQTLSGPLNAALSFRFAIEIK